MTLPAADSTDGTPPVDALELLERKIRWHQEHPPVYTQGISEAALLRIREYVGELQYAPASTFAPPHFGGSGEARRHLRLLCALIPESIEAEHLPVVVLHVVNNPDLTVDMVREILAPRGQDGQSGGQSGGATIQWISARLREGWTQTQIARARGAQDRTLISEVSQWIGVADAWEETLREWACDLIEEGGTARDLAHKADIGEARAQRIMREVRAGLEEDDEWES